MFESYNQDGSLQFNAASYAYAFVSKGTMTISNRFTIAEDGGDGIYLTTEGFLDVPGGWDIVVFRSQNAAIIPRADSYGYLPSNRFAVVAEPLESSPGVYQPSTYTETVYYWIFKSSRTYLAPSSSGVGLELYNADGTVCYSSTSRPLMVVNNASITSFSTSWTASVSLPAGRTYAHLLYGTVKDGPFLPGVKSTSSGWSGKTVVRQSGTLTNVVNGGILTVDVTGY